MDEMEDRVRKLEAELFVLKALLNWYVCDWRAGERHVGIELGEHAADLEIKHHHPWSVREYITPER